MLFPKSSLSWILKCVYVSKIKYPHRDCCKVIRRSIIGTRVNSLTVRGHKLADRRWGSAAALHEHHLRDDDVVLEHGAAAHTHGITASLVHVHIRPTAVLTPPHCGAVAVTSATEREAMTRVCLNKWKDVVKINTSESRSKINPIKSLISTACHIQPSIIEKNDTTDS